MALALANQDLVTISCCNCGVLFCLTTTFRDQLRQTHNQFYCPNGHPQWFPAKTEADKLRETLEATRKRHDKEMEWLTQHRNTLEKDLKSAEAKLKRQAKRALAGVCPCCNRTVKQMAAHIKSKHPEYKGEKS